MRKLDTLNEVVYALADYEILITIADRKKVFFMRKEEKIKVRSEGISYYLTLEEFKKLYGDCTFYVYEEVEEVYIDKEKDDEYYSWWHK